MDYSNFLVRLKEERKKCEYSQRDLSCKINMLQSHYSKVEKGINRFSYNELQRLCKTKMDVYYIFTGRRHPKDYIEELNLFDMEQLGCCIRMINMIAKWKRRVGYSPNPWKDIYEKTRYVEFFNDELSKEHRNAFKRIRISLGYTQVNMAEIMGIDIKRLRAFEKSNLLPDSEMISKMYRLFGVSPVVFLRDQNCLLNEISGLIDEIKDEEIKRTVVSCIKIIKSC